MKHFWIFGQCVVTNEMIDFGERICAITRLDKKFFTGNVILFKISPQSCLQICPGLIFHQQLK